MKPADTTEFLQRERGQTDSSLTNERGKTDESLSELQKNIEFETNQAVQRHRVKADKAKNQNRVQVDQEKQLLRKDIGRERMGVSNHVQESVDVQTDEERQKADQVLAHERKRIDQALQKEREIKDAATLELLSTERGETDVSLTQERDATDVGFQVSSKRFADEQASHTITKTALTTRDEFLAIVSHDLRSPIGSTLSYAELLLEHPAILDVGGEVKSWIEIIKRNSESALRLINDLLDMERMAEGHLDLNFDMHNLDDLVIEAARSFAPLAQEKKIQLKTEVAGFPMKISCDSERIEQVLSNLIGNALKFTPEGGVITLSVTQSENDAKVSVADTGPGIPESEKKRIFERFAQIGKADRRGLGLGLYISNMLVQAHQGQIWVESTPGQGSTFSFCLPMRRKPLS